MGRFKTNQQKARKHSTLGERVANAVTASEERHINTARSIRRQGNEIMPVLFPYYLDGNAGAPIGIKDRPDADCAQVAKEVSERLFSMGAFSALFIYGAWAQLADGSERFDAIIATRFTVVGMTVSRVWRVLPDGSSVEEGTLMPEMRQGYGQPAGEA